MKASGHEQRIEKTEEKREILTTGFLSKDFNDIYQKRSYIVSI